LIYFDTFIGAMPDKKYNGRRAEIYFPAKSFLEKWEAKADAASMTLSSWIFATVEQTLDDSAPPLDDVVQERTNLQEENRKLRKENENLSKLMEAYKTEAFTMRNEIFLQKDLAGSGEFDSQLVRVIRSGGVWRAPALLKELDIDAKDVDAIQIVTKQLQTLQDIGVVKESATGWKWVG